METYTELQNKRKKEERKKKKRIIPIILIILGSLFALILAVVLFFYFKMKNMSRNAPPVIPSAIVLPDATAAPAELIDVDDPGYISVPERKSGELTPEEIEIIDNIPVHIDDSDDPDYYAPIEPDDPDYEPFDPEEMEPGDDPIHYVPQIDSNIINILILGNDAKAEDRDHGRTDVMHVLSYNKTTRKAKLVAIIRDTYLYIPGRDQWNRINTAFRYGGVGLAMNTINVNFGLDIQHYIRVDFTTMPMLINMIGGIDLELSVGEIKYLNRCIRSLNLPLEAGVYHLNGAAALRHARNRYVGTHVWSRAERHNQILNAVLERMKQQENPVALMALMYQLADKLDTNMDVEQMVSLGVDIVFGGGVQLRSRTMPFEGTWSYAMERGMAVIKLDIPANKAKLHEYLYGN